MRHDGVDANAILTPFIGRCAGELLRRRFDGGIDTISANIPAFHDGATEIDDVAFTFFQMRIGHFHQAECGKGTGVKIARELFIRYPEQRAARNLLGVIDEDVQRPKFGDGFI